MSVIEFKQRFKLCDDGLGTQNLHSLIFNSHSLVSEVDLGNIEDILLKNKKLQNNWNELKKYIKDRKICTIYDDFCKQILDKMQELEEGVK